MKTIKLQREFKETIDEMKAYHLQIQYFPGWEDAINVKC